jgi:hypothetical protein
LNAEEAAVPHWNTEEIVAPGDTVPLESVSFDSIAYTDLKAQKKFDYYKQQPDEPNALQRFRDAFFRWMRKHFNPDLTEKQFNSILVVALLLILVLAIVFLYIYKPSLFYLNRKQKLDYQLEDEDIEGLNLDRLIQEALQKSEYTEAIRWTYLKTLKTLNEREWISFDPNKTVNEYVNELKRTDLKSGFRNLSRQFIYYRYGNREASREIFERFQELSNDVQKRLAVLDKS